MSMFYSWEIFHFGIVFGPEAKPVELNDKSIVIKFIPASIKPSKQEYKGDLDECYREAVFSSHTHNSPVLPALSSLSVPVRSSSDLWLTTSDDRAFVSLTSDPWDSLTHHHTPFQSGQSERGSEAWPAGSHRDPRWREA